MKRKILILSLMAILSSSAFAQHDTVSCKKNEFTIGYGIIPATSYPFRAFWKDHFSLTHDRIGTIYTSYTRQVSKRIGIGVTICYDPVRLTYTDKEENITICKVKEDCVSIMPHIKFYWVKEKNLNIYSKLAGILGYCFLNYRQEEYQPDIYEVQPPKDSFAPALHCTLFGVDFKKGIYNGFMQLGLGNEGLFSFGLRYEL